MTNLGGAIYAHTMSPTGSLFIIVAAGKRIVALQDSGTTAYQAWAWPGDGSAITSYPALSNNDQIIYVQTGIALYSLSMGTGQMTSGFAITPNVINFASPTMSLNGNLVFVGTTNGMIAVNAQSGGLSWQFFTATGAPCLSTASVTLYAYVGCSDGGFYALNLNSGFQQWYYSLGSSNPIFGGSALGTNNEIVFATTTGNVYCLSATAGLFRWSWNIGGNITSSMVVAGTSGDIYVASQGVFYSIN